MAEIIIKEENFEAEVLQSDKPVLLDFWAEWCGPCKMLAPILAEIAEEHPEIKVGKINVDEQQALGAAFEIQSIPTVILFREGKPVTGFTGYRPKEQVEMLLEQ